MISNVTNDQYLDAIRQQFLHNFTAQISDQQERLDKAEKNINPENNPDNS